MWYVSRTSRLGRGRGRGEGGREGGREGRGGAHVCFNSYGPVAVLPLPVGDPQMGKALPGPVRVDQLRKGGVVRYRLTQQLPGMQEVVHA